jgi:ParB-like chromosome segregation protein Spo0J
MNIESWPVDRPIPYAQNARKISEAAIAKVATSLKEFGWRQPVVVDAEGVVIAGHTRLLAAQRLGLKELPVHVAEGLTPAQVKAYRLMDNRSHEEADWDVELLAAELVDLSALDLNMNLTGFDEDELAKLLNGAAPLKTLEQQQQLTYRVIVECDDERHQAEIMKQLETQGFKCQPLIS